MTRSIRLAFRNLVNSRIRFVLSVAGVALAITLVLVLRGFRAGLIEQFGAYLRNTPGSIVVAQAGVSSFFGVSSLLPPGTESAAAGIDGVSSVVPILTQSTYLSLHGKRIYAFLIGYDPSRGGGPWRLASGREPTAGLEVVIDRRLAGQHDLRVGDVLTIGRLTFPVVGLSEGTTSWMTSLVFIRRPALESLLLSRDLTSYLLVTPVPQTRPDVVRARLLALPDTDVWLKEDMIAADLRTFGPLFAPITLMSAIAFVVGALLTGLVVYADAVERQQEYGVLKAIGINARRLYQIAGTQAAVIAMLGAVTGAALAYGAAALIMALRPQFLVAVTVSSLGVAAALGALMALLAGLVPIRIISGLAPAEVFRR